MNDVFPAYTSQIGRPVDEVLSHLRERHPSYRINEVGRGQMVTQDWHLDRVRVYYDENRRVTAIVQG